MSPAKFRPDDLERAAAHFNAFASAFVNPALASRWQTLFMQRTPTRWPKVQPWKLWTDEARVPGPRYVDVTKSFVELQADASLAAAASCGHAVAIGLGHSTPRVVVKPFRNLMREDLPLEGIVSFDPGRQVLVINHDGDMLLCTR